MHAEQFMGGEKWDMIIAHPPCTALSVSGNRYYAAGTPGYSKRRAAIQYTGSLWYSATRYAEHVCFENPVGVLSTCSIMGKASQSIQPYHFGHDASKTTCLWLKKLPLLRPTNFIEPRIINGKRRWGNQTDSGQNRLAPSETRAADRARTYTGIAEAMAEQWGGL